MGNVSIDLIDLSLNNIWRSWFKFRQGKQLTKELEKFQYYLEDNLWRLHFELNKCRYCHSPYRHVVIKDSKRRNISVASIKDRVVHRLIYEYLVKIYDKTFIFDAWSCRANKGLIGAIDRTEKFFKKYPNSFVWRADIIKFFDNINQGTLFSVLNRRIKDEKAVCLLREIIGSYRKSANTRERERE